MSAFEIEIESGKSVRLPTADKYCDKDIRITAKAKEGGYDEGYAAGQQTEYDRFWDGQQDNGERTNYDYAFYGEGWNDTTYNPKYPIVGRVGSAWRGASMTNTLVDIVVTGATANAFAYSKVVTIPSIDLTGATNTTNCFNSANNLVNVTFAGIIPTAINMSACPLTNESVQSAIDHLKDLTGEATQTLTLKDSVGAKLTEAQKTAISAKNWTLVY